MVSGNHDELVARSSRQRSRSTAVNILEFHYSYTIIKKKKNNDHDDDEDTTTIRWQAHVVKKMVKGRRKEMRKCHEKMSPKGMAQVKFFKEKRRGSCWIRETSSPKETGLLETRYTEHMKKNDSDTD